MVRRGRAAPVTPPSSSQRRLDEAFGEHDEARAESEYRDLRESRASHAPLPYEERVAAWVREREEAIRRLGALEARAASSNAPPALPAPAPGPAPGPAPAAPASPAQAAPPPPKKGGGDPSGSDKT